MVKNGLLFRVRGRLIREYLKYSYLIQIFLLQGKKATLLANKEQKALLKHDWSTLKKTFEKRICCLSVNSHFYKLYYLLESKLQCEANNKILGVIASDYLDNIHRIELIDLYNYYRYFGSFIVALLLRNAILDRYVHDQKNRPWLTKCGLNAILEICDAEQLSLLLKNKNHIALGSEYRSTLIERHDVFCGKKTIDEGRKLKNFTKKDKRFLDYVKGRTIAIVGPAVPKDDLGDEIDSFDIIVRTNYRNGSNFPINKFGNRTDISYYNQYRISSHLDEVVEVSPKLDWVVLKSEINELKFNDSLTGGVSCESRSSCSLHQFFSLDSAPQAIPSILNDLILFSPKYIKIFCVNLFNSEKNNYTSSYKPNPDHNTVKDISNSLRIHEPFAGFRFVKSIFSMGLCDADKTTTQTLELTTEEYADNLQRLYGKYGLF